ncbi:MFS transporter [Neobacillus mesonae]|nr:MFS transporter [Neobacillus mesonae]
MAGMDGTVVAAALPSIVSDLGGFDIFIWVTSAYMVMMMASTPIFGKLSDMYGRKRFFVLGLILFLLGSVLCGISNNMIELIIFRAIQGIGGGSLMPIAFTIVADIFPPHKRGKMMGIVGAVFGISSIFGPLLGAFITEYVSWNWVFFVNLPIGLLSFLLVFFFYLEPFKSTPQKVDWWGASTLVLAVISLMLALQLGGNELLWSSPVIIGLFITFIIFMGAFLFIEKKASDPIISFVLFRDRLFTTSCLVSLFIGFSYIAAITFIPIFVQGVWGDTAKNAGLILMPMMLGSVVGSSFGGWLTAKISFKNIMLLASIFFVPGIFLLSTLHSETSFLNLICYMTIVGCGAGLSFSVLSLSSMHNFNYYQRGSASSTNRFSINLGMTIGITVFGIIQRVNFTNKMESKLGRLNELSWNTSSLLTPQGRAKVPEGVLQNVAETLASSIGLLFLAALIPAALAVFFIFLMPNDKTQNHMEKPIPSSK